MKTRKAILYTLLFILIPILAFAIYAIIPRVLYSQSPYNTPLKTSSILPNQLKSELETYARDSSVLSEIVVGMHGEEEILGIGKTDKLVNCHSVRKSIMSLLIGIARDKGLLDLNESLGSMGIDESQTPLTAQERSATLRDLLMARSGIYLPANAETDYAKSTRPKREQYKPGEYFFYNNFDFNVVGVILEQKTGKSIGQFMEEELAKPLGLQEFTAKNIVFGSPWPVPNKSDSDYLPYWMFLSARDLARIGMLVAQDGQWNGQQVVSSAWLKESLQPHTDLTKYDMPVDPFDAYGYWWWIDQDAGTYWADGFGGQYMIIDPANQLVLVQRNFTGNSLLSSGLYLKGKNRDRSYRGDLSHIHNRVKPYLKK